MSNKVIETYNEGYAYYVKHRKRRPYSQLLVPIDNDCNLLFDILCLSNYEIAEWQWFFLELWHENTDTQFIDADILLTKLGVSEVPVLKKFFQPNEYKVSICTFLEFICLFTFFSYTQLIPILCSINSINSNRVISTKQITTFLESLKVSNVKIAKVFAWVSQQEKDENGFILLYSFCDYIENYKDLFSSLNQVKMVLITNVIGQDTYHSILYRKEFYLRKQQQNNIQIDKPSESCCTYLYRVLITHRPPIYYFDHMPFNFRESTDLFFHSIRKRYGYIKRLNSSGSSRPNTYSSHNLLSSRKIKGTSVLSPLMSCRDNVNRKTLIISQNTSFTTSKSVNYNKITPLNVDKNDY